MVNNSKPHSLEIGCTMSDGDGIEFTKSEKGISVFLFELGGQGTVVISHDDAKKLADWLNKSDGVEMDNKQWKDRAQLPRVRSKVKVDCHHQGMRNAVVIATHQRWVWADVDGIGLDVFDLSLVHPQDELLAGKISPPLGGLAFIDLSEAAFIIPNQLTDKLQQKPDDGLHWHLTQAACKIQQAVDLLSQPGETSVYKATLAQVLTLINLVRGKS